MWDLWGILIHHSNFLIHERGNAHPLQITNALADQAKLIISRWRGSLALWNMLGSNTIPSETSTGTKPEMIHCRLTELYNTSVESKLLFEVNWLGCEKVHEVLVKIPADFSVFLLLYSKKKIISLLPLYYHLLPAKKSLKVSAQSLLSWNKQSFPHILCITQGPSTAFLYWLFCSAYEELLKCSFKIEHNTWVKSLPAPRWPEQTHTQFALHLQLSKSALPFYQSMLHTQVCPLHFHTQHLPASVSNPYSHLRLVKSPALRVISSVFWMNVTWGNADLFPPSPRPAWPNPVPSVSPSLSQTLSGPCQLIISAINKSIY